jgi:hypothetical protein
MGYDKAGHKDPPEGGYGRMEAKRMRTRDEYFDYRVI